jgi:hypothetical protein
MVVSPWSLEELEGDLPSLKDSFRNGTISFSELFGGSTTDIEYERTSESPNNEY